MKMIEVSEDALDSLKRMVEELERDAARWCWIKTKLHCADFKYPETDCAIVFDFGKGVRVSADIDATVDAAMNG